MNKHGKIKTSGVLLIMFVAVLLIVGMFFLFSSDTAQSIVGVDDDDCDSTTTPQLTIKAIDIDNPGTAFTEATNLYRLEGTKAWTTFTQGTAFDVIAGETYEIVMGITTSDFTDNAYGDSFTYTAKCQESDIIEVELYDDEVETSLSATFYNADGNAVAETFSTGETQTVSVKLKASTDNYFGNPYVGEYPNVIVIALNSSEWDAPEQVYLSDGTNLKSVEVPSRLASASQMTYYAYELPAIGDKAVEVMMDLNSDDSVAVSVDGTAYMYAGNWYINGDTADVESGVETEENVAVGTDAYDSVTLDFTA